MLHFNYKHTDRSNGTSAKAPLIPVTLRHEKDNAGSFNTLALIDSGADISAIPLDIAETLELDLTGVRSKAFGLCGSVDSIDSTLAISISKGHEIYNMRIPVKVICSECEFSLLLGRLVFFDRFIITFDEKNFRIGLKGNQLTNRKGL